MEIKIKQEEFIKTLIIFSDWKDMMHYAPPEMPFRLSEYDNVVQIMVTIVGEKLHFSMPIVIRDNGKDISTLLVSDTAIRTKMIQMVYNFEDISSYLTNEKLGKIELGGCDINNFMDDIVETLKENCDITVNKDLYYLKKSIVS